MPGVAYEKQVQFTLHGPVVVHVLTAPRPGGLWSLEAVLSNETILGRERVTDMQKRLSAGATVAGVNGDLFNFRDGHPSGILIRDGALDHPPIRDRSSIGIDSSGTLRVDRVSLLATWQGAGPRRALTDVNGPPGPNGVSLFTPSWGPATPAVAGSVQVTLQPFPRPTPNGELPGPVVAIAQTGPVAIPPDGAVLVARGNAAQRLAAEAAVGGSVLVRLVLEPDWAGVVEALGGGPVLVRDGKPVFRANEVFTPEQLVPRHPRTAVGQLADGRIVLVAVDGRRPGYSSGMTNFELAMTMVRLGAVTAAALDAGGSTTMAFDGRLLNRPSDPGGERAVAEALLVSYAGAWAPPPSEPVLSPNGDGIGEQEVLGYKIVRPSTVTVSLVGPDGVARPVFSGPAAPGFYPFTWTGLREDGTSEPEGRWRFVVEAVDDLGRSSQAERAFALNRTLGFPKRIGPALAVPRRAPRAVASFTLTRPAVVTARIETPSGIVLRTLPRTRREPGPVEVAWDGSTASGATVYSGRYVARIVAANELGSVELTSTFSVRRLATAARAGS